MTKREINKYQLHTFYTNYPNNHFDSIVRKVTEQIVKEKKELSLNREDDIKKRFLIEMQIYLLESELLAITQMRIIYAYKQFEIQLKKLISVSYGIEEKNFYKWQSVVDFLYSKNIDIKRFENYQNIQEILELNNSIKHSPELINKRTQNILEFRKQKSANANIINEFYERTMNSPKDFITELAKEIDKDLYEFDDYRLDLMAEDINKRMDNETKNKFLKSLNKTTNNI